MTCFGWSGLWSALEYAYGDDVNACHCARCMFWHQAKARRRGRDLLDPSVTREEIAAAMRMKDEQNEPFDVVVTVETLACRVG